LSSIIILSPFIILSSFIIPPCVIIPISAHMREATSGAAGKDQRDAGPICS
jgi:hypothetical protein